jgi:ferredoxin
MPADPRNVRGEFYVEKDCCLLCGVPWHIAPELFGYDDSGCWVTRQPATADERHKMLQVIDTQELDCIRRRGTKQPAEQPLAE